MNKLQTRLLVGCAALILLFARCVDEITINEQRTAEFFVVDGIMNFSAAADSSDLVVKLGISRSDYSRPLAVSKAIVEIIVNDKDTYPLVEREAGAYYLFRKDIFVVGSSYKLKFQANGSKYESSNEVLADSVPIQKAYAEFNAKGTSLTAHEIFVDVQDVAQKKNYYRWAFVLWEAQQYCQFCYVPAPRTPEQCTEDIFAIQRISRNRNCDGNCYDILRYSPNNAVSDIFFDGKNLIKKSIGYIPYNFYGACLVEVSQSSITPQYDAFLEILKSQAENTGGLADTPAALLVGNIKNLTNAAEPTVGYFSVTNTSKRRIWIDRKDAIGSNIKTLSSAYPPLEIPQPTPPLWAPVPCKPSKIRTNIKPAGWKS
jgi:Domain of unknown function (DUF4249)